MKTSAPALLPIFRSEQQLRLLGHLFILSGREFSVKEIQLETGIPQATVSREVARLEEAGLLRSRQVGRSKLIRADEDSPSFTELRSILLKTVGPAFILRDHLLGVSGVEEAHVFGSWARRYHGERGAPPQDLDVVVIGRPNADLLFEAALAAEKRLGLEVNPVIVEPEEWNDPPEGFFRDVRDGPLVTIIERGDE
jgi:DNA-binding transcriptional ArsR family regulator